MMGMPILSDNGNREANDNRYRQCEQDAIKLRRGAAAFFGPAPPLESVRIASRLHLLDQVIGDLRQLRQIFPGEDGVTPLIFRDV